MAKDKKLNKSIETMTPRRATDNCCDGASPVDSPELDEFFEPLKKLVPNNKEVDETLTHSFQDDSVFESKIPSFLESPRIVRPVPHQNNKKRMSVSAFFEALASCWDESDLESSGIPSQIESPEDVSSQNRLIYIPKSRVSTTTFKDRVVNFRFEKT